MFGNGLVMSQGEEWVRHRHVITPAFNPTNLKAMASLIVETTNKMLDNWKDSGPQEIDVEREITATAGDIIAKTSFGISYQSGRLVFEKLIRTSQMTLFKTSRHMGWVMNEALRLYPSSPIAQRQAKAGIHVIDDLSIPSGTNIWIDIVGMHHDPALWGEDVNKFKPERFKDDIHGGCKHKMGYLPFGFGGRMCIGRNLTFLEYKIVLTLILTRLSFTISPTYSHSPSIELTLRPSYGLPLALQPL
ncbi:hypothetical protein EV1_001886 [Malus domestica]